SSRRRAAGTRRQTSPTRDAHPGRRGGRARDDGSNSRDDPRSEDMSAPRWATALLRRLAPDEADVLIGDLEEAHRARVARRGAVVAALLTSLETVDVTLM